MPSFKIIGLLVLKKKIFKSFAIHSHGGHLGHVTLTIYANFHSLFLRMLQIKFGFDSPRTFREKRFEYFGHRHVYSPGAGIDNPLGLKYYHKHKSSVKFSAIKWHFSIFPIQMHGRPKLTLP